MSGPMQWSKDHGLVPAIVTTSGVSNIIAARVAPPIDDENEDDDDAAPVAIARPTLKRAPTAKAPTPKDVVRLARARLRDVKAELKRMRRLEEERAELERLIAAAENKPCAVVREFPKRTAG
jgi:hypothetical protein